MSRKMPAPTLRKRRADVRSPRSALFHAPGKALFDAGNSFAEERGRASGHRSRVLSLISAVLLSNDRCRQNAPSGMVKTTSPIRFDWRASAAARSIGSMTVRPPINTAAARNAKNTERIMATRAFFACCSSRRTRADRRADAPRERSGVPFHEIAIVLALSAAGIRPIEHDNDCAADKRLSAI